MESPLAFLLNMTWIYKYCGAIIQPIKGQHVLKILLVLWKSDKELTVYKICQHTGLGRSAVSRHLHNLVEAGLVSRRIYGEILLYTISKDNPNARALTEFFTKTKL